MNTAERNTSLKSLFSTPSLARMAMMIALVIALGQVSIPLPFSPVPLTGQTLAIILVGLLMTPLQAFVIIGLWIAMGTLGLPVFSMFRSGPEVLLGPSGGYIIGFLACAVFIAFTKTPLQGYKQAPKAIALLRNTLVVAIGSYGVIYAFGVAGLMRVTAMPFTVALAKGVLPFLIGDTLKLVVAVLVCDQLLRTAPQIFVSAKQS